MGASPERRQRRLRYTEIGMDAGATGLGWPPGDVVLASAATPEGACYLLTMPDAVLRGEALTGFLDRVAPFGCPPPGSLIRAYSLPDSPFPSILLKEHEAAPAGVGDAYNRFLARSRVTWLGALQGTGPGLSPTLAWQTGATRRFLAPDDEWVAASLAASGRTSISTARAADDYLGRALLLLADPDLATAWQTMMSLGGVTKIRKITGREFPVWVDLPAHQPDLLASRLLARAEQLLASP
jgi:hypothetical protein